MHEILVNRIGGLNLPKKCVARLSDRPDMTSAVYRGGKTTPQQQHNIHVVPFSLNDVINIAKNVLSSMSQRLYV